MNDASDPVIRMQTSSAGVRHRSFGLMLTLGLLAALGLVPGAGSTPVAHAEGDANLVPLVPARLLDTRQAPDLNTIDGEYAGIGRVAGGTSKEIQVAGRGGVDGSASSVMLNVTAVAPDGPGYLTVYPCTAEVPLASHVNYFAGDVSPNVVLAKLTDDGAICVFTLATSDIIIDVTGYVPVGGAPIPVDPARLVETRQHPADVTVDHRFEHLGRAAGGSTVAFDVWGRGGVPTNTEAVYLNVTAIYPDGPGYLTVYPCTDSVPEVSNVNYGAGDVSPNAVLATVSDTGSVCVYTSAEADIIADVNAYLPPGGNRVSIEPARRADTRADGVTFDHRFEGDGPIAAGGTYAIQVGGRCNIGADASAAYLNVTAYDPAAPGYLTVWPCDETRRDTSNVNYDTGDVQPNSVLSKIGLDGGGQVCIYSSAKTHVIVDANGFVPAPGLFGIDAISTGFVQTCALMIDGAVWCWGEHGHLGDGGYERRHQPEPTTITDASQVVSGSATSCAVLADATAMCWGDNRHGQVGDGTTSGDPHPTAGFDTGLRLAPVAVTGLTGVTDISTWYRHSCAIAAGDVWCWGTDTTNQLGADVAPGAHPSPIGVVGLPPGTAAIDIEVGNAVSCAILNDGTVWCWGDESRTGGSGLSGPSLVGGIDTAVDLAVGENHVCAVLATGGVQCWGSGFAGQLGNGLGTDSATPVAVTGIADAETISAGTDTSCARLSDGTAECWGSNKYGEAGDGSPDDGGELRPVVVAVDQPVTSIETGRSYSCAVLADTSAACWGGNVSWILGAAVAVPTATPVIVGSGDHTDG